MTVHENPFVPGFVLVAFEDVIAEPPSVRTFDHVWSWSHALFVQTVYLRLHLPPSGSANLTGSRDPLCYDQLPSRLAVTLRLHRL